MASPRVILVTGGTGYLGGLVAVTLLLRSDAELVVPVRSHHDAEGFWGPARAEIVAETGAFPPELLDRVHIVDLPPLDRVDELGATLSRFGVNEIVHCAGCLDYFDPEMLEKVNIGFTRDLVALGRAHLVDRFVYVSTAFSSGLVDIEVVEDILGDECEDPTDYTRSKRGAEQLIAASGLPYLILRPPIVIGHSVDGRYGGKRYGIYQLWSGMERLLFGEWYADVYFVGSRHTLPLIHQDAFQDAFDAAYRLLPDGTVFNMVASAGPNLRDMALLWYPACMAPERVHLFETLEDVPLLEINRRQRAFLGLTSTNIRIASHNWTYETANTDRLRAQGSSWTDPTVASVGICQDRFTQRSEKITQFIAENSARFGNQPEIFEPCPSTRAS